MNLENFTLIVLTHNRHPYLERLLTYYSWHNFPFKILVLDSSVSDVESEKLKELISAKQVSYKKFSSEVLFENKIFKGLKFVETEYSALLGVDDYLVPNGIEDCVNFLDSNKDYDISHGLVITHTIRNNSFFWGHLYHRQKSVLLDDPIKRLEFVLRDFHGSIYYSVYRTSLLKLIWREASGKGVNFCLLENLIVILGFMHSKVKILPCFYLAREMNTYHWNNYDLRTEMYKDERCSIVIDCWAKYLSSLKSINIEQSRKIVKKYFDDYLLRYVFARKNNKKLNFFSKFFLKLEWHFIKLSYSVLFCLKFSRDFSLIKKSVLEANINPKVMESSREQFKKVDRKED